MGKSGNNSPVIRAGALEIDLKTRELRRNGQAVTVEEQPFQILSLLVERPGKVISRAEILEKLWSADGLVDPGRSLDIAIDRLRQALGETAEQSIYLEVIPGSGYRFKAKVSASTSRATPPGHVTMIPPSGRRRWLPWVAGIGLAIAVATLEPWVVERFRKWNSPPPRLKLAVLPFKCLSGKAEDTPVCDGLTDEITARLGRVKPERLGVIGTTSVWRFKNPQESIQAIGGLLGADHIVEGSVDHQGEQVRISVKLVLVAEGTQLWSQTYDRTFADMLALESEIAERVAAALAVKLLPEEMARLKAFDTANPQAHEAFVKGRNELRGRTAAGYQRSVQFYQEAIHLDPNYARAYAGLADVYDIMGFYGILPPADSYQKAREAANTALRIDDTLGDAHVALALVLLHYDYDWEGAGEEFRRAIQREDDSANAHYEYSIYLALRGRVMEGLKENQRAQELDSGSLAIAANWVLEHFYARAYDQAVEKGLQALNMDPNFALSHFWLGRSYEGQGKSAKAITELSEAVRLQPETPFFLTLLAHAYGAAGRKPEAQQILEKMQAAAERHYISPVLFSIIYVGLGDPDRALAMAEKAQSEHAPLLTRVKRDPILDSLRADPRFQALVRQVGPPD